MQQLPLQFQPAFPNKNRKMIIWSLILLHISITMCPSKRMKVPGSILTLNVWCSFASKAVTSSCKVMTSRNCPQSAIRSEQSWARFIFISSASSSGFSIFWSQEKIFTWFTDETIMYRQELKKKSIVYLSENSNLKRNFQMRTVSAKYQNWINLCYNSNRLFYVVLNIVLLLSRIKTPVQKLKQ